ncbi:major capsid protein E [Anaerobacterium chartisolvens]|uniref:Major capsid protein E n=1 Tax=Anaerobacterium chartisolvens TaxID=1297424 RepID=A0A369BJY7_9FIRM|nr:major capsid protein [Anaerobacterium chartisolvens]RCX20886.1 major capsid protein E [Anaerobacterium chartisolvens]
MPDNVISLYSTRTMLQAINIMKPVHTFLRDTFFPGTQTFLTENVDVDFKKGKRKMAPFVAPRVGGIVVDRQGFETRTFKFSRVAPQRILTKDDLNTRSMGEAIYSTRTPDERAQELLAGDIIELDDMITSREEWMCRELLFTGKVTMKEMTENGKHIDKVVDYNFTNKEILTGGELWTDPGSDPIGYLGEKRLEVIQKTGKAPTICIMASDVSKTFINHEKVQKIMNLLRINIGVIEPSVKSPALTYIGRISELDLELYSYDEWFLDDDDTEQPMIPEKTILLGTTGMNKRYYGAITQMENGTFVTYEGTRIPKVWSDEENEVRKIRLSSRPLPVPEDIDSWYVAVVK